MPSAVAAIVPAAGSSVRLGGRTGKPFVPVHGQPLLAYTLRALQESPAIRWIIPVIREADRRSVSTLLARYRISKSLEPCLGGPSRAESVARGFAAVPPQARWVLIHDGARPCVSRGTIGRVVETARRHGAAACGLPASLTVKAVDRQREVRLTLDRESLWFVQTPQVFRRDWFAQSLEAAGQRLSEFPDDAALVESAGFRVRMVPGDPLNLKVTTKEDLLLAEAILNNGWKGRRSHGNVTRLKGHKVKKSARDDR